MAFWAIAPLVAMAAASIAQAVASSVPNKYDRHNKRRIAELSQGPTGLTGRERNVMGDELFAPSRDMATALGNRADAAIGLQPAGGAQSLLDLRDASMRSVQDAQMQGASALAGADLVRRREQEQELERRMAVQSERAGAKVDTALGTLSDAASVAGAMGGDVPLNLGGMYGQALRSPEAFRSSLLQQGFDSEDANYLIRLSDKGMDYLRKVIYDTKTLGDLYDPQVAAMLEQYGG